jgi:hypothetical protein
MSELRQRFVAHMRLARGGFYYVHHILDGEKVVGTKTDYAATRTSPIKTTYALGDLGSGVILAGEFDTAKDFIAAYEAQKKAPAA